MTYNEPTNIITIEVVDTHESYGFEGKVVATSDVRGFINAEIVLESARLLAEHGDPQGKVFSLRYVEEVGAAR